MKLRPQPYSEYKRSYWTDVLHFAPLRDRLTFEKSPTESWSFPLARLIRFKQPTPYSLQFAFPTHSVKVVYRDHADDDAAAELLRKILLGKVSIVCAYLNLENATAKDEETITKEAVQQLGEKYYGVFRVQHIEVESK